MNTPFQIKYAPYLLTDIVFASQTEAKLIDAYAKGNLCSHLLLYGTQGTGKSAIANLLPSAIEGQPIQHDVVDGWEIKNGDRIIEKMRAGRNFARSFSGSKFGRYYLVVEELAFSDARCSKFWTELDKMQHDSLVIITTNDPMKINKSILSRLQCIELKPASPAQFLPRARWVLEQEGLYMSDSDLLKQLSSVAQMNDNRKYLQILDQIVAIHRSAATTSAAMTPLPTPAPTAIASHATMILPTGVVTS